MKHSPPNDEIEPGVERLTPSIRQPYNSDNLAVIEKVQQDILFLTDRIERIRKLQTPNSSVLKTYLSMLNSREAVLHWLKEDSDTPTTVTQAEISEAG